MNALTIQERVDASRTFRGEIALFKEVLTIEEAAQYSGFKKSYLYSLTSGRKIPFYKPGSKVFFKRSELDAWIFKNRVNPDYEIQQDALNLTLRDK